VRYADDSVTTASTKQLLSDEIEPLTIRFLQPRGLRIEVEKTRITRIEDGFDFLGFNIRKYDNGKLIIKPSKKNVSAFINKIRQTIRKRRSASAGVLITQLNRMIRGWANYHRAIFRKRTFAKVDNVIFNMLWRWAKRRHPNKGLRFLAKKYFKSVDNSNWNFSGEITGRFGILRSVQLIKAAKTPITRHIKIKGAANPYDYEWEEYFEKRIERQMMQTLRGRNKLRALWKEQKGICPQCQQMISQQSGWERHHILPRSMGGSDLNHNLVLLHPNCHRQVHAQGLSVRKPRPP